MPPGRPERRRRSADACLRWAVCLVEPLLPLRRLACLDEALGEATRTDPDFVALVFAGTTADVVRTLPPDDSWRSLALTSSAPTASATDRAIPADPPSAPLGAPRSRQMPRSAPQERPGAAGCPGVPQDSTAPVSGAPGRPEPPRWPSGRAFGTWRDGTDLVELAWGSPERDPAFAPLADDLAPGAARVLVAAFSGWRPAFAEARALLEPAPSHAGLADALRWACWRRRAYGLAPAEDVWPYESIHHWAERAFELLELGKNPDEAVIESDITWHRIAGR